MSFILSPLILDSIRYSSAQALVKGELNKYPTIRYLTFYIDYSDLRYTRIRKDKIVASQKEFAEKRYNDLVKEVTREAINSYLKVENLHTGRRETLLTSGWALDSYLGLGRDRVKGVFSEKVIRWYLPLLLDRISLENIIRNLVAWGVRNLNIERKEMNSVIWEQVKEIKTSRGGGAQKGFKKSPLFGKSASECCYILDIFFLEWLLGKFENKDYSKPKQLKEIEKFHKVDFHFPKYHITYLYPVANSLGINPDKLGRFLREIKFPYFYILSGIRLDGKKLYLMDDFKLHEYQFFIEIYFKTESNYRKWKEILNDGFSRGRGCHTIERRIKSKIVPCYYFDIVPPTKEFVSHFLSKRNQPIELPEGIWMPEGDRPLTHKEIKEWLKNNVD